MTDTSAAATATAGIGTGTGTGAAAVAAVLLTLLWSIVSVALVACSRADKWQYNTSLHKAMYCQQATVIACLIKCGLHIHNTF
jgi:hypothetical protein